MIAHNDCLGLMDEKKKNAIFCLTTTIAHVPITKPKSSEVSLGLQLTLEMQSPATHEKRFQVERAIDSLGRPRRSVA